MSLLVLGGCPAKAPQTKDPPPAPVRSTEEVFSETTIGENPSGETTTITNMGGDESADVVTAQGVLPEGWPEEILIYPGAILGKTTMTTGAPETRQYTAAFTTEATAGEINDYYRDFAENKGGILGEYTLKKDRASCAYFLPYYRLSVDANQLVSTTEVMLMVSPPLALELSPPMMAQTIDLDVLPPNFPEELLPRYQDARIVNGFVKGKNFAAMEMLTTDDLPTVAAYYREYYKNLGWPQTDDLEKDIVVTMRYESGNERITVNIGSGGSQPENHISLSWLKED
ncbi:hypothetical protein JW859_06665 [bacterium]|nr:hypothetical protein [bacterium]